MFSYSEMSSSNSEDNDMRSYLQFHADHVTRHLAVRPVVRHLLKKGIITVTKAQDVISMETEEGKQEATFRLLLSLDRKQMEDLCYYLDRNNATETANILAASLYPLRQNAMKQFSPRNMNNNAIEKNDSPESKLKQKQQPSVVKQVDQSKSPNSSTPVQPTSAPVSNNTEITEKMPVKVQSIKGQSIPKQDRNSKPDPPNSPVRKQYEPVLSAKKDSKPSPHQNSTKFRGASKEVATRPHRAMKDTEDTKSIQDLTLIDDLAKNVDVASTPEKVRWKDGRYIGTDYVKLHIQKFFTRKVVHTRKEGDVDVQETSIKETEVKEERMKGVDTKEITVRKQTTEEKWEELKTKTLEPGKTDQLEKGTKPLTSAVSMLEIRRQESPKKVPPKAISLENVTAKGRTSNEEKLFKIVTERVTKKITPQTLDHIKTTKPEQSYRKSMPELMAPPAEKKVLSKPRLLCSYTLRDQYNGNRSSYGSLNPENDIPEEPVRESIVQKSLNVERIQKPHESNRDVRNIAPPTQEISPKPAERKKKGKPDEYFEIIESSVKCFQPKIGKGVSKDSLQVDTKSTSSLGDDVVLSNKENKNTLNYRTQYKSSTPQRELPTIINSDQTYKLRDQYSLRRASEDSQDGEPFYRKKLEADKKIKVNQGWKEPVRHMPNDKLVPGSRPWGSMEPNQKRLVCSGRQVSVPHVTTENTQQFVHREGSRNERQGFTPEDRYEAETCRVLAEIQRQQYNTQLHEEPFNQRQIPPDSLPDNSKSPRREKDGIHLDRGISEPGQHRSEAEEPEPHTYTSEIPRPVLKKYVSEKSLPKSKGLRESAPAQPMGWSTVSLPDVQNVQESHHKSNLNKWKETNLDTSSDSSDTINAGSRPTDEYYDEHDDKDRGYLINPYVMSYPVDDEDPKYFVRSVMDQARTVRYNDTNDERNGWIETDLDAPPGVQYMNTSAAQDDHVYENENSGWWVETDLDSREESSRDNTFNRGFISDNGRQDKYWKSLGFEKYPPFYQDEDPPDDEYHPREYRMDRDHEPGTYSRRGHLYENLDTHVRYPGERDRYLDLSQELHPKHDGHPDPEDHHRGSTKHVHYEDQVSPRSHSSRFDEDRLEKTDQYEKSRSLRSNVRDDQQREIIPVAKHQKYNSLPDMKRHKRETKKKDHRHRHSDHSDRTDPHRDPYFLDQYGRGIHPDAHERSFEISPDMYYSHSFGSSETNWRPHPEVSPEYDDEPHPQFHASDPEYWERIPIEGQHSPPYDRNPEGYPPRNYAQYPRADPIPGPGLNPQPVINEVGHREAAERVSLHNNSDLGFHELSFASMASSEHLQDNPRNRLQHPEDSAGIEGMRFKQIEVHRTTAAALSAYNTSPEQTNRGRSQINSPRAAKGEGDKPRRRSREDNSIYENLRPIDNYWSDHGMDRARKGELDLSTKEREMNVYGHEQGFETGSYFGQYNGHRQRHTSDRIYTQPPEGTRGLHRAASNPSKKERSMSYRYRPQSEHLEQHKDMIQEYLDEINKNVPSSESKRKSKKHKRHSHGSTESPRKQEPYYPGYDDVHARGGAIKPTGSHTKHKHSHKNSSRKDHDYVGGDVHQTQTLPRSLKFGDHSMRPQYEMYQPYVVRTDNKGFIVTGNPQKTKKKDHDVNTYFLSQV